MKELRLRGTDGLEQANAFFPEFMADDNQRLAVARLSAGGAHREVRHGGGVGWDLLRAWDPQAFEESEAPGQAPGVSDSRAGSELSTAEATSPPNTPSTLDPEALKETFLNCVDKKNLNSWMWILFGPLRPGENCKMFHLRKYYSMRVDTSTATEPV